MKKKLGPEFTAKCKTCRHGKGAHKRGACAMHHCKCTGFAS